MLKQLLFFLLSVNICFGQLPDTDIWLFKIVKEKNNLLIQKGTNITNRPGYDNQPAFSENGKDIYYVSIGEDKQADILVYSAGNKKTKPFTQKTKTSEYSPTLSPDKTKIFSVVVLEDSSQVILALDIKTGTVSSYPSQKTNGMQINSFDSVGYFTFLNSDTVLYYKLTQPHSLRAVSLRNTADVFIASSPARGFKAINRYEFIYGIKDSAKVTFYRYNTVILKAVKYCEYPSLNEDIVWHPSLGLLKSEGPLILRFKEAENKWETLFDFSGSGIKKITRFAFDSAFKQIAIVDNLK
ncbi:MAG: PD40 domain-containing protein [Bacteroidetes bacterium]|nr:PD40 domain-containing protein [Bacteroidota bacterium]